MKQDSVIKLVCEVNKRSRQVKEFFVMWNDSLIKVKLRRK